MQNPTRSLFAALLLSLPLAFLACDPAADPGAGPGPARRPVDQPPQPRWTPGGPFTLQGPWTSNLDSGVIYFAGRTLSLDFDADSVTLRDHEFTDAIGCQVDAQGKQLGCSDYQWTNTYRGAWSLEGRTLHIAFHFTHTTASRWTENHILGPTAVDFDAGPAEDRNDILVLTRTSAAEFLVSDTHFTLYRPE